MTSDAEIDRFATAVTDAGVQLVGLNFFAGDMPGGDRGLVSWPARSTEFRDNIDVTVGIGERLGCPRSTRSTATGSGRQLAKDMCAAVKRAATRADPGCNATEALAATAEAYVMFVPRHRVGFDFVLAEDLTVLRHRELAESGRAVMDVLLPLTLAVAGDPTTALRLLDQHIAAAHGLGSLYTAGFARSGGVEAVATAAAQVTRTLAAAAQRGCTPPSITAAAVAA